MKRLPALGACLLLAVLAARPCPAAPGGKAVLVVDPYAGVAWERAGLYRAGLHVHTTEAGGFFTPAEVIREYAAKGFRVLSITDHNRLTWPWEDFLEGPAPGGLLAVPGVEISRPLHHLGAYFCSEPPAPAGTEAEALESIGRLGGLAVLFHPGRYAGRGFLEEGRYESFFRAYPHLVGLEVFNAGDRYPGDRALWDELLGRLMPERPVWGFSGEDLYFLFQVGLNYHTFILADPGCPGEFRRAMAGGRFFSSFAPPGSGGAPVVERVEHDPLAGTVTVFARGHERVTWISRGAKVHEGESLDYRRTPGLGNYFRAEVAGAGGSLTLTNPFGLSRPGKEDDAR